MLIITGPGRSGTSLLAQFCKDLGFDPGGEWYDGVNAGLEYPVVVRINDAILKEAHKSGKTVEALKQYSETMRSLPNLVVKDPRFSYHPAVMEAWSSVRQDLTVLLTYRKPEHSIASRKRLARALFVGFNKRSPDKVRIEFANTIETLLRLNIRFKCILFPHFLKQYDEVMDTFAYLGLDFDESIARAKWDGLVNPDRVHFK